MCAARNPEEFERCLRRWTQGLAPALDTQVVALDGQALRRAHEAGCRPLQVVSAWASAARLVLAPRAVPQKANELSALPLVLEMLALDGCIVTIDALGTPAASAHAIVDTGADDVRALNGNQGRMEEDVHALFAAAAEVTYAGVAHSYDRAVDGGHGRSEIRQTWAITAPAYLAYVNPEQVWPELRRLILVRAERRVGAQTSVEQRYSLSRLAAPAQAMGAAIRAHWGSETSVHWVLDLAVRQDESRARVRHAARNLATLQHLALNVLRAETTTRVGIAAKRHKAGWDHAYLLKVLQLL